MEAQETLEEDVRWSEGLFAAIVATIAVVEVVVVVVVLCVCVCLRKELLELVYDNGGNWVKTDDSGEDEEIIEKWRPW